MESRKIFITNPVITGMITPSPHLGFSGPIKSRSSGFNGTFQSALIENTSPTSVLNFNSPFPESMSFAAKPVNDRGRYVTGNSLPTSMPPVAKW